MANTERLAFSELPKQVGLEEAIELNQHLWRDRDHFLSVSSPIEIPGRFTKPVFDRVIGKYAPYIREDIHKTKFPLVGLSVLPELMTTWGWAYYQPDFGKLEKLEIFEEFGTDWLTRQLFGQDPYKDNRYLKKITSLIENDDPSAVSFEKELLSAMLYRYEEREITEDHITDVFARILIGGDVDYFKKIGVELENGEKVTYGDETRRLKAVKAKKRTHNNAIVDRQVAELVKPRFYLKNSLLQIQRSTKESGVIYFPGVINLSDTFQARVLLTHEFIHSLAYHKDNVAGVPIKGYKPIGGTHFK